MRFIIFIPFILGIIGVIAFVANAIKLSECDFVAPYRCEAIHGIGLLPPAAIVTVWFDSDKVKP